MRADTLRPSHWTRALYCKGCRTPVGMARPARHKMRRSRWDLAERELREAADAAVCDHCRGLDRDARKAARRAAIAAEAAKAAERRAARPRGLTQDERAQLAACPLVRCAAQPGQECLWIAGALTLGSGATHAARLEAACKPAIQQASKPATDRPRLELVPLQLALPF